MDLGMLVMSAGKGPQEAEVSSVVNRVNRIQWAGANRSSENMNDSHGL